MKLFKIWKNINRVLTVWDLKGHFDFFPHVLPISFNILFNCFIYFFSSTNLFDKQQSEASVPSGDGALPHLLDHRPFS